MSLLSRINPIIIPAASRTTTPATRAAARLSSLHKHLLPQPAAQFLRRSSSTMATSIPNTMKGIQISKNGGVEVLEWKTDLPVPKPQEGQILVKNDFVGVNYIDTYFRAGAYKAPKMPYILGREGAGTVAAVGPGAHPSDIDQGTQVAYLAEAAYAEYTAVNSDKAIALPSGVSTETAAAALLQGLTALTLIREGHPVKKGDWVLLHAAAGGMGLWLCQTLRATGAHVIGTASTPEKRALAKDAGAEIVLEYPEAMGGSDAFVAKVKELTGGKGCIAVLDGVGKSTLDVSIACVARKGTVASFGNASGAPPPFEIARLAATNAKLMRPTLFNFIATREEFVTYAGELLDLVAKGKIDVRVHHVYPLQEAARAHTDIEGRGTTGKLMFKV